ncbi:unnamed protein product [Plutella xylostella]|uniref:(diamondback moth) hypothetical protein n=1 Tax=Plutella xylostella TaxID=51655 RepID=A0A8S4FXI3_PLUXY|nr:unnamed protein product [Plutella xylostella]
MSPIYNDNMFLAISTIMNNHTCAAIAMLFERCERPSKVDTELAETRWPFSVTSRSRKMAAGISNYILMWSP